MKRLMNGALLVAGTALVVSGAAATPAAAATSGRESFTGTVVFAGIPGTGSRVVIGGVVVAKGVFGGVGRYVELPTDPSGASRADLVFPSGTIHLVSTVGSLSYSINPHNCLFTGTQQLTWKVSGGTGAFADATGSFAGTVNGRTLLVRNPDGSCSFAQVPPHEVDKVAESGTLSF